MSITDNEREPLLSKPQQAVPVPWLQLFFACAFRASQPIQYAVIFPYVCQYIEDIGVARGADVGPLASYVEISASVGCYTGMAFWTWASDRYGRRPVVLSALVAAAAATSLFGFSTKLWHMMLCRFLLGLFNGQMAVSRVIMIESSHPTNLAFMTPYFTLGWQIGETIGPAIGGALSRPADSWSLAASVPLLVKFPYALPTLVAAAIPLALVPFALSKLEETHPHFKKIEYQKIEGLHDQPAVRAEQEARDDDITLTDPAPYFLNRHIVFFMVIWLLMQTIAGSNMNLLMLVFYAPPEDGGLNLLPAQTSVILMIRTIMMPLLEIPFYGRLDKRFGSDRMLKFFIWIPATWPFILPLLVYVKTYQDGSLAYYCVLAVFILLWVVWTFASTTGSMLIADLPQRPEHLGKIAAISEIAANVGSPIGLVLGGNLFRWSKRHPELLHGNMVWVAMFALYSSIALLVQRWKTERPVWRDVAS